MFEADSDSAYTTLTIMYSKKTATLVLGTTMPYSGLFDETFREMMVLLAQGKKEGSAAPSTMQMADIFRRKAMETTIMRNYVPRPYRIDF
jgi:hypothetical protein